MACHTRTFPLVAALCDAGVTAEAVSSLLNIGTVTGLINLYKSVTGTWG